MKISNIHAAKTHLSKLLVDVENGEEIIIAKAGKPVAKLVPYSDGPTEPRKPGRLKGKIVIKDNRDEPEDERQNVFQGIEW
ncbi:MAG: type II toxin-antitoxin system prevent-host-death family antitoxin [Candidatus Hinthialibacter antarcticus]|nr:type II toxin-antitoxin system prevent-host-death family antitoxin [Candidatus Hinthialibacter antarcticus]